MNIVEVVRVREGGREERGREGPKRGRVMVFDCMKFTSSKSKVPSNFSSGFLSNTVETTISSWGEKGFVKQATPIETTRPHPPPQ